MSALAANCWTGGKIDAAELAAFTGFDISPVRNEPDPTIHDVEGGETNITRCAVGEQEFWAVYGRNSDGTADALHDCDTPDEVAAFLIEAMRLVGAKPVGFSSDCWFHEATEMVTLCEDMSFEVARRAEQNGAPDDPEGMAEAMDEDPLMCLHEALSAVAPGYQSEQGALAGPFAGFTEWDSAADEVAYANL